MATQRAQATRDDQQALIGDTFTIRPLGPFSLHEAATFGFGQRHDDAFDGTMRLAFCVGGGTGQAGVAVSQDKHGDVHAAISGVVGEVDRSAVAAQVARVLSLDQDATEYAALGDCDPIVGRLLEAAPGLRPPLFYSPYEAALWSVLSARRPMRTASAWRRRLSEAAGARFHIAGQESFAVPVPGRILELGPDGCQAAAGIEKQRAERVVAVADASNRGLLDIEALTAIRFDEAQRRLRTIPGIGPFYADLILIRATGLTDALPVNEPRILAVVGHLYGFGRSATQPELEAISANWRPWRTWVTVLCRAAGGRGV